MLQVFGVWFCTGFSRVKGSALPEQQCQTTSLTPAGVTHAKIVCSKNALDKNVHQLAQAMLTTLEGIVPQ